MAVRSSALFSDFACDRGDALYESPDTYEHPVAPRSWYQRDIDQIVYSTAFRKMQGKSQLLPPQDPRRRTRLIHTLEVARIARETSGRLGLNTTLTEAMALGHDLGSSACGKPGNRALADLTAGGTEFAHESASSFMVQILAAKRVNDVRGMEKVGSARRLVRQAAKTGTIPRWTWDGFDFEFDVGCLDGCYYDYVVTPEVLDGIANHGVNRASTVEGQVLSFADNIAYISQDIEDLQRSDILDPGILYDSASGPLVKGEQHRTWDEINAVFPDVPANGVLHSKSGIRIGTAIERFVRYNEEAMNSGTLRLCRSGLLSCDIPVLEVDQGLQFVIDFAWEAVTGPHWEDPRIRVASEEQEFRIRELFTLLSDSQSPLRWNPSLSEFMRSLGGTLMSRFSDPWKTAFLICHLSWDEVQTTISNFQKRDYGFFLDLLGDVVHSQALSQA